MIVKILEYKTFKELAVSETAKYLNKGDIFLPDGSGWEYKVLNKVMYTIDGVSYHLNVIVKKL